MFRSHCAQGVRACRRHAELHGDSCVGNPNFAKVTGDPHTMISPNLQLLFAPLPQTAAQQCCSHNTVLKIPRLKIDRISPDRYIRGGREDAEVWGKTTISVFFPRRFLCGAAVATVSYHMATMLHPDPASGYRIQRPAQPSGCLGSVAVGRGGRRGIVGPRGRGWQVPPLTLPPNGRWGNPTGSIFRIFWQREKVPPQKSHPIIPWPLGQTFEEG